MREREEERESWLYLYSNVVVILNIDRCRSEYSAEFGVRRNVAEIAAQLNDCNTSNTSRTSLINLPGVSY